MDSVEIQKVQELILVDRIISLIRAENRGSIRVAERVGESLRGRTALMEREYLVYGIDREEYGTTG